MLQLTVWQLHENGLPKNEVNTFLNKLRNFDSLKVISISEKNNFDIMWPYSEKT